MLDQIALHYGTPRRACVVHNGRTPSLLNPHASKDEVVMSVGRLWDSGKNAGLLLREEMPLPVYIIGADRHPEFHGGAFTLEEIRPNIHLEPRQDEEQLSVMFSRAAIYAATSQYEPFGLAPLEAALSRCALVASDIPPFRELWEGAAVFFRNNDARDLRETLETLSRDPGLCRRQANLAYDRARQSFTAARMLDDYMELYSSLVPAGAMTR
jgi:glycogen(starch) synthase